MKKISFAFVVLLSFGSLCCMRPTVGIKSRARQDNLQPADAVVEAVSAQEVVLKMVQELELISQAVENEELSLQFAALAQALRTMLEEGVSAEEIVLFLEQLALQAELDLIDDEDLLYE